MPNHLLVVDDEEINNFLIGELLSTFKEVQRVEFFISGWDALDFLKEAQQNNSFPDLILVDLNMPEMDGYEFTERFEAQFHSLFPKTKIIILSNSIRAADQQKSLSYKVVHQYMNKPLDEDKLLQIIGEFSKR